MNIILQHWNGIMPDWAICAEKSMKRYAQKTGAEYKLVRGTPMGKDLFNTPQKLCMINEEYDDYDQVCMIDMDTLATNVYESFWNRPEIGVLHRRAMRSKTERTSKAAPALYTHGGWTFFGNWIKLNREQRKELRKHWNQKLFVESIVDAHPGDEIIMHYLINKSGILDGKKITDVCMRNAGESWEDIHHRDFDRWDRKFCNQPEDSVKDASIIHFCAGRKKNMTTVYNTIFKDIIL